MGNTSGPPDNTFIQDEAPRSVDKWRISYPTQIIPGMNTYRMNELVAAGLEPRSVRTGRVGEFTRLRHGGYRSGADPVDPMEAHRALISTTAPLLGDGAALSHVSAGVLWQLPVPFAELGRVHATQGRDAGGRRTPNLHLHVRELPESQLLLLGEDRVTSLGRTAVDLARLVQPHQSLAVLDQALRMGVEGDELAWLVNRDKRRHGVQKARWALGRADARAESPAESISRYWMLMAGLPEPELQYEVRDANGVLLGRADFAWPELGIIGEFDGRIKYDELVGTGETAADVVMREKHRELQFRAHGWWVIRWTWQELKQGWGFANWLRRALANAPSAQVG